MINQQEIAEIESIIGYEFKDKELLKTAFNHVSYANEHNMPSNETLEFLGDSVLNFVVAEFLYDKELADEGQMSVIRSKIVSRNPLAREVKRLGLLPYLKLGSGFDTQKSMSPKFISNIYEAVAAAIYKDSDLKTVKEFIKRTLIKNLDYPKIRDFKTRLQELIQSQNKSVQYEDLELLTSPPTFLSKVYIDDKFMGEGKGERKKDAQQAAARAALTKMFTGK